MKLTLHALSVMAVILLLSIGSDQSIFSSGTSSAKAHGINPSREVTARYGKAYLENVSGLLVLHVEGSPYEMGYQYGVLLKDRVRWMVQYYLYDIVIGRFGCSYQYLVQCSQVMEPHIPEEYIEEMHALADGAEVNYTDLMLLNISTDVIMYGWTNSTSSSSNEPSLCSNFYVFEKATSDGHLIHARNNDWILPSEPCGIVVVYEPDSGNSFVNIGAFSFLGTIVGINEKQISVDLKACSSNDKTLDGIPRHFMCRKALQYSENLSRAIEIVNQSDRTVGAMIGLGDGLNLNACALEISHNYCKIFWAGSHVEDIPPHYAIENAIRRTNHFVDPELRATQSDAYDPRKDDAKMGWSWSRYEKLGQLILDNYGKIDAEKAIEFLRTPPITLPTNYQSIVLDATHLELWVANANSTTPAYLQDYIHLSRSDLFPMETDLNKDRTVNILDITIVAAAYGSKPGDPKWNVLADLDMNGQVNIIDVTMVAKDYGKTV